MAYRIEENISWRGMWENLHTFLTELTNIYDISYESANGNGVFSGLSVPAATSTTETWTLICTDASYPQTFSVQGNITGNTATATVDTLYNNGIVSFTLVNGDLPWLINDIISFSTESTITPPWKSMGSNDKPLGIITRFLKKSTGQYPDIRGQFVHIPDGPKEDSCSFTAEWKGLDGSDGNAYNNGHCLVGLQANTSSPVYKNNWSCTYWARKDNSTLSSSGQYSNRWWGENWSPVGSGSSIIGGWALGHKGTELYLHTTRDLYAYIGPVYAFNTQSYYLTNPTAWDTWVLHTLAIDGTNMKLYLEDTLIDSWTNAEIVNISYAIPNIMAMSDMSDVLLWDKTLQVVDIQAIMASPTRPNENSAEVIESYTYELDDIMPKIMVKNEDSDGNNISAVFSPQNQPFFSYKVSTSFRGIQRYNDTSVEDMDIYFREPSEERRMPSEWPCESYNFLLGGEPNHLISKYWFVANNEFIIVAYKTYDPNTQQQLPVYQIGYVGKSRTVGEQAYKVHLGTYSSGEDYWYTGSTTFRSGVLYTTHATWLGLGLYDRPEYIYYSPITAGFLNKENSYNVYPIIHGSEAGKLGAWSWDLGTCTTKIPQNYGELFNLSGIQTTNVTHEDIVIIDGIRHIALGDTTRAGSTSLILLKLD